MNRVLTTAAAACGLLLLHRAPAGASVPDRREALLKQVADGALEAALPGLTALAETETDPALRSEICLRAALVAERLKRLETALQLAERIPLAPVAAFARMQLLAGRRQYRDLWETYHAEAVERWAEQCGEAVFERLPPLAPDQTSTARSVMGNALRLRGMAARTLAGSSTNLLAAALRDLERAAELIPPGYWGAVALTELAELRRERCDDPDTALQLLRRIRGEARYRWHQNSATLAIADILLDREAPAEAGAELERMPLKDLPPSWRPKFLTRTGRVLEALGERAGALERYRDALRQDDGTWPGLTSAERRFLRNRIAQLTLTAEGLHVLAANGRTTYQLVLPDRLPDPQIEALLREAARLVQQAFAQNGFALPIVAEAQRDAARPGLFLGDTAFAREQGLDLAALHGWAYVLKRAGPHLILAGRDARGPADATSAASAQDIGYWLGTVKGVTDFLHRHAGARFLSPCTETGIAFRRHAVIAVPDDLELVVVPLFSAADENPRRLPAGAVLRGAWFYRIANNFLAGSDAPDPSAPPDAADPLLAGFPAFSPWQELDRWRERPPGAALRGWVRRVDRAPPALEGPAFYAVGRFLNAPQAAQPREGFTEYLQAAFGGASAPMARFFEELDSVARFQDDLPRGYRDPRGRARLHLQGIQDRLGLVRFLFPPSLLSGLEAHLSQAEGLCGPGAERSRMAAVRREFDRLHRLADVANLALGYQLQPDRDGLDRLLDAVQRWQAQRRPAGEQAILDFWDEPPLNWDVEAMRRAPLPAIPPPERVVP